MSSLQRLSDGTPDACTLVGGQLRLHKQLRFALDKSAGVRRERLGQAYAITVTAAPGTRYALFIRAFFAVVILIRIDGDWDSRPNRNTLAAAASESKGNGADDVDEVR